MMFNVAFFNNISVTVKPV